MAQPPKRSKDGTAPDLAKLESEKRDLYLSGTNSKRLKEVIEKLDWLYYGIEPKPKTK